MNIHPLWFLCLLVRLIMIYLIYNFYINNNKYKNIIPILLIGIGIGFTYQGYYGSNNEKQISKVFWHDTRFIHASLYSLSGYYLYNNKLNISLLILCMDILFSIFYRILFNI